MPASSLTVWQASRSRARCWCVALTLANAPPRRAPGNFRGKLLNREGEAINSEFLRREREADPQADGQHSGDHHQRAKSLAARGCYDDAHRAQRKSHLKPEPGADAPAEKS